MDSSSSACRAKSYRVVRDVGRGSHGDGMHSIVVLSVDQSHLAMQVSQARQWLADQVHA
ncbi:hypothetical protein K438DRAFT_1858889 [Mycena galopus ATCC 62051]|nr:hypothetical protein K438DRAFT_1858889 [Mycena galopus ATCC 62051]